jgi:hypothetical protein
MDRLDYGNSAVARIAVNGFQNNLGSGPRESGQFRGRREAYHTIHRIFHPPGSAGSSFKTERFEWPSHIRAKIGTIPNPLQNIGEARHYAAFVLGAHSRGHRGLLRPAAVVGTVYELDTLMAGITVSG